ncbi:TetR/AcrR family transcriptional regulator [Microbacterium sp. A84]|uniref:TetR/AcrR family transcriptional regulator n=1 Tax=Microbacterium sp. A84 TaxID=3450715 RepID=UPI003F43D2D1
MARSSQAREALMNSAEELFAELGVDAVSSRRIAEHAGASNHSAVAYHFGTREDLLRALLRRHAEATSRGRAALIAELGAEPSANDILRCRLLPYIDLLSSLPRPSWHAQFLAQIGTTPSTTEMVRVHVEETGDNSNLAATVFPAEGISDDVKRARSAVVGQLVLRACADYERQLNSSAEPADWAGLANFLIDACAGMLTAPVTRPQEGFLPTSSVIL